MNAEQLNAIKERAAKATPGPWFFDVGRKERLDCRPAVIEHFDYDHGESFIHGDIADITDAEFIAYAREDVPVLVAEVERLKSIMAHIYEITHDTFYYKNEEDTYEVKQRYYEDRINIGEIMIVSAENSE